jgi:hypothetical protein
LKRKHGSQKNQHSGKISFNSTKIEDIKIYLQVKIPKVV